LSFRFGKAPLQDFTHILRHGELSLRCGGFSERVEYRPLLQIDIPTFDSEHFFRRIAALRSRGLGWKENFEGVGGWSRYRAQNRSGIL